MVSLDQAQAAKETLKKRLGRPSWLRGIGISRNERGDYVVKVNVAVESADIRETVPRLVEGVEVQIDVVGDIHAAE